MEDYEDCLGPFPFAEEGPSHGSGEENPLPYLPLINPIPQGRRKVDKEDLELRGYNNAEGKGIRV